jgi:hypothetical protein
MDRAQIDTVIRMNEGAAQLTLDSCELTFTGTMTLQVATATFANVLHFAGGVTVADKTTLSVAAGATLTFATGGFTVQAADVTITDSSLSFAGSDGFTVRSDATATFTGTSLSFAAGVGTGLDVQTGATATATGTTFQAAEETTVAVSVEEGGTFTVESSRLAGADGAGCERAALPLRIASPTC